MFQPPIKMAATYARLSTVSFAAATDMVNGKELHMIFPTAYTNSSSVGFASLPFQFLPVIPPIFPCSLLSRGIVLTPVCLHIFFTSLVKCSRSLSSLFNILPSHKNTASSQLAALTRQAGERQLEVIIP